MRIAIFGGAFNPVHREHVNLARAAIRELKLDKLIIMPTAVSPHKSGRPTVDFFRRFEMCRLAFSCLPEAEVSNYELTRGGISYTYLTCGHFANVYRGHELYYLIGADMLGSFTEWRNPSLILKDFRLAACAREETENFYRFKREVEQKLGCEVTAISYVGEKVSSTAIRTLAALGEDFGGYVNAEVCQYIKDNGLYAIPKLFKVKELLTPERWAHTVRVAVLCAKNAQRAGLSEEQAVTMAALHDCAKYLKEGDIRLAGFVAPDCAPPVLHQYAGAFVAKNLFGVRDETVLNAIACHATGREDMTEADKLLYLADLLEEGRSFDGVDELRRLFKKDLTECMLAALEGQLAHLAGTGRKIDPMTERAYAWLKAIVRGRNEE